MTSSTARAKYEARLASAARAVLAAGNEADAAGLQGESDDLTEIYVELGFLMQASLSNKRNTNRRSASAIVADVIAERDARISNPEDD